MNRNSDENKFVKLMGKLPNVAIQGYNKNREVIYWNNASEIIYGFSKEEALGKKLEDLIIPSFMKDTVIQNTKNWYEKNIPIPSGELSLIKKDGSIIQVYSSHVMLNEESDNPEMFCIDIDLTEQKNQENQLIEKNKEIKEREIHFRQIFENVEVSIWNEDFSEIIKTLNKLKKEGVTNFKNFIDENNEFVIDMASNIKVTDVNEATLSMFEAEDKDSFIYQIDKTFGKDALEIFKKELLAIWNKKQLFRKEASFLSLKGKKIRAIVSFRIPQNDEEFKNIPVSILDITEKEKIRKDNQKKEKLLYQQSKLAAMGEMLGNIAHQWRQPLSIISSAASGGKLKKEIGTLTDKELDITFDTINESTQYLSQTIEDFRTYFDPREIKQSEFKISYVINRTIKLINPQYLAKEIIIIQNIEDTTLNTIENELIQVLVNILNNSRDALMNIDKNRYIFISTYLENDILNIEIKDNAGGIREDLIDRVFEPYITSKHKSQGTGIGLYMCEEIVRTHMNGIITAENETYFYNDEQYTGAKFTLKINI